MTASLLLSNFQVWPLLHCGAGKELGASDKTEPGASKEIEPELPGKIELESSEEIKLGMSEENLQLTEQEKQEIKEYTIALLNQCIVDIKKQDRKYSQANKEHLDTYREKHKKSNEKRNAPLARVDNFLKQCKTPQSVFNRLYIFSFFNPGKHQYIDYYNEIQKWISSASLASKSSRRTAKTSPPPIDNLLKSTLDYSKQAKAYLESDTTKSIMISEEQNAFSKLKTTMENIFGIYSKYIEEEVSYLKKMDVNDFTNEIIMICLNKLSCHTQLDHKMSKITDIAQQQIDSLEDQLTLMENHFSDISQVRELLISYIDSMIGYYSQNHITNWTTTFDFKIYTHLIYPAIYQAKKDYAKSFAANDDFKSFNELTKQTPTHDQIQSIVNKNFIAKIDTPAEISKITVSDNVLFAELINLLKIIDEQMDIIHQKIHHTESTLTKQKIECFDCCRQMIYDNITSYMNNHFPELEPPLNLMNFNIEFDYSNYLDVDSEENTSSEVEVAISDVASKPQKSTPKKKRATSQTKGSTSKKKQKKKLLPQTNTNSTLVEIPTPEPTITDSAPDDISETISFETETSEEIKPLQPKITSHKKSNNEIICSFTKSDGTVINLQDANQIFKTAYENAEPIVKGKQLIYCLKNCKLSKIGKGKPSVLREIPDTVDLYVRVHESSEKYYNTKYQQNICRIYFVDPKSKYNIYLLRFVLKNNEQLSQRYAWIIDPKTTYKNRQNKVRYWCIQDNSHFPVPKEYDSNITELLRDIPPCSDEFEDDQSVLEQNMKLKEPKNEQENL